MLAIDQSGSMQARDVEPTPAGGRAQRGARLRRRRARRAARGRGDLQPRACARPRRPRPTAARCDAVDRLAALERRHGHRRRRSTRSLRLLAASRARRPAAVRRPRSCCSPTARPPTAATRSRSRAGRARARHPDLHGGARHRRGHDPGAAAGREQHAPSGCRPTARPCARWPGSRAGRYYEAADAPELDEVYERLGSQVSTRARAARDHGRVRGRRGAAAARGGAASLRWFGRLPERSSLEALGVSRRLRGWRDLCRAGGSVRVGVDLALLWTPPGVGPVASPPPGSEVAPFKGLRRAAAQMAFLIGRIVRTAKPPVLLPRPCSTSPSPTGLSWCSSISIVSLVGLLSRTRYPVAGIRSPVGIGACWG